MEKYWPKSFHMVVPVKVLRREIVRNESEVKPVLTALLAVFLVAQAGCIADRGDFLGGTDFKKEQIADAGPKGGRSRDAGPDVARPDVSAKDLDVPDFISPTDVDVVDVSDINVDTGNGKDLQDVSDAQLPNCGDEKCNGMETCESCKDDCGTCSNCGDSKCDLAENCHSCQADCPCGDGEVCTEEGACCQPGCEGKKCGGDGCGGFCGGCNPGQVCSGGQCTGTSSKSTFEADLIPLHDTYATHNDETVHGFEPAIKVGIEPQECSNEGWNPCPKDGKVCCEADWTYNFCAPEGQCETIDEPTWKAHRKFRGYIRFDLAGLPAAKVVSAVLKLHEADKVEEMGGPPNVVVAALKKIGMGDDETCEWSEQTLNDTNGTTWNSLPQNASASAEGVWAWDVIKAVTDWVNGNSDKPGNPIEPNCGLLLYDPDFGKIEAPIQRWVLFSSKESGFPPQLSIALAQDLDGDGAFGDCDEEDSAIHPGAIETCDGIDNDCNGMTDDEVCDGIDNDCDGAIDEGETLCGVGMMCIYHQCVLTCADECAGPYDMKCVKNDSDVWEIWHCKDDDKDPCLEYYMVEECKPDELCNYGYCSSNCVDLCEPEQVGTAFCHKDSVGQWYMAGCDDYDGDGCLEAGGLQPCGPGADCASGACGPPCIDECTPLGEVNCKNDEVVQACFDSDDDGCLEWTEVDDCGAVGKSCAAGKCQ